MAEMGKYIYGIINSGTDFCLFVPKDNIESEKDETNRVYTVSLKEVSALIRDSKILDYIGMPKDSLARLLVEHQRVIERVMASGYTVIPMRLGTFAANEDEVRDILNKGYSFIKDIMTKVDYKIEIDVAATWSDFTLVLKEVSEEKEIKEFKEKLLANPKGITVDDQMKVGLMVKKALDKKREECAEGIQNILKSTSQGFKAHELMDDKMVMNSAFLIEKLRLEDFNREVEKLNNKFEEKLNFKCVGPLPPYSFYTLEVKKMQPEEVNWARKKLGILNDAISKDEIKKIFHRQAFISHPDKNPDKAQEAEKEYDEITRSYKILLDYAQACEQVGQGSIIFNEDEFKKNAVLVKVRE